MIHRVHLNDEPAIARLIITRNDITLESGYKLRPDVYGALTVKVPYADLTDLRFEVSMICEDDDPDSVDFLLDLDFTDRAMQLGRMTRPKSLQRHFPTTVDLGTLLLANEGDRAEFQCQLTREWLAQFLAANFTFKLKIERSESSGFSEFCAVLTLTDPRTGREEKFIADFYRDASDVRDYISRE